MRKIVIKKNAGFVSFAIVTLFYSTICLIITNEFTIKLQSNNFDNNYWESFLCSHMQTQAALW